MELKALTWDALVLRVRQNLLDHCGVQADDALVVAVSGGPDSICLMELLCDPQMLPLRLTIAHVNHQLRGTASDEDEQFVRERATCHKLPYTTTTCDVRAFARTHKRSLEDSARQLRYDWLLSVCEDQKAKALVVAHQADDQAETVLLRMMRGAGLKGLAAMPFCSPRGIIRPLLDIDGALLRHQLQMRDIPARHDDSNDDCHFLRNRVRHELIPVLRRIQPDIVAQLCQTAHILADEEQLLATDDQLLCQQHMRLGPGWRSFRRDFLATLPKARRRRLYRMAMQSLGGNLPQVSLQHLEILDRQALQGSSGSLLTLPQPMAGSLTRDLLFLYQQNQLPASLQPQIITSPGRYELAAGLALSVTNLAPAEVSQVHPDHTHMLIDPMKTPFPWVIRSAQPGERIRLSPGISTLISDLFTNAHIPRPLRPLLPVLSAGTTVFAVPGLRRSNHGLLPDDPKAVMLVTLFGFDTLPIEPQTND